MATGHVLDKPRTNQQFLPQRAPSLNVRLDTMDGCRQTGEDKETVASLEHQ